MEEKKQCFINKQCRKAQEEKEITARLHTLLRQRDPKCWKLPFPKWAWQENFRLCRTVTRWCESPPWKAGASQSCSSSRQRASAWQGAAERAQQVKQQGWSHSQPGHPLPSLVQSTASWAWSRVALLHFCQHSAHPVFQRGSCRIHPQGSSEIAPQLSLSQGEKNPTKQKEKTLTWAKIKQAAVQIPH